MSDPLRIESRHLITADHFRRYVHAPFNKTRLGIFGGASFVANPVVSRADAGVVLNAEAGSISITGFDVTLTATQSYVMTADPGSVSITGAIATLSLSGESEAANTWFNNQWWPSPFFGSGWWGTTSVNYTLDADPGSIAITGQDVTMLAGNILSAEVGSISITGFDVTLSINNYGLNAEPGSVAITGSPVAFLRGLVLDAEPGAITISGSDIRFEASKGSRLARSMITGAM